MELLIEFEAPLRFGLFASVFAAMAAWEIIAPRRILTMPKAKRWIANLAILVVNTALVRALAPAAAVGIALVAERRGTGLLNFVDWPFSLEIVLAVVVLDLVIYLQHAMFHSVPLLWRLHRVHHADLDIDVTTGTRFHPIEMLLSLAIKAAAIFLIGAPVAAVLVFEIALNLTSMFNHANVRMPRPVDAVLRLFVVTPDMHRIHHSVRHDETDSNFGFNLPWWDRLFGTYRGEPRDGHERMVIGVPSFRDPRHCIALPFLRERDAARSRPEDLPESQRP